MSSTVATGGELDPDLETGCEHRIEVALGRRVEVLGDLLLPPEPTDSSRAACRDIARRLEEWQGPGIVILCGRLAGRPWPAPASSPPKRWRPHPSLRRCPARLRGAPGFTGHRRALPPIAIPPWSAPLEKAGVTVHDAVDLHCETGAGMRTVLVRAGTLRPGANPPLDESSTEDRPWLVGLERLDDPALARRFVTSRLLYRRLRRYLWAPPLVLAAIALLLRVEFVVDGLGHLFRSPASRTRSERAYDASWFSRFVATVVIAVALLVVLAIVVALTSRGIWRALGGEDLPAPWSGREAGTRPIAHALLEVDGQDALDMARGRRRGRCVGRDRRWRAGARAHPPRCWVLRLSRGHLRGGPRAPGALGPPADLPAPPPGVDPRDRDRAPTCTSASCWPRRTCPWPRWASVWSPPTSSSRAAPRRPTSTPSWPPAGPAAPRGHRRPRWRPTTSACAASGASPPCRSSWPAWSTCSPR